MQKNEAEILFKIKGKNCIHHTIFNPKPEMKKSKNTSSQYRHSIILNDYVIFPQFCSLLRVSCNYLMCNAGVIKLQLEFEQKCILVQKAKMFTRSQTTQFNLIKRTLLLFWQKNHFFAFVAF